MGLVIAIVGYLLHPVRNSLTVALYIGWNVKLPLTVIVSHCPPFHPFLKPTQAILALSIHFNSIFPHQNFPR